MQRTAGKKGAMVIKRGVLAGTVLLALAGSAAAALVGVGGSQPASVSLRDAVARLPVAGEHRAGYRRELFEHWTDDDGDRCDTRDEVLLTEAVVPPMQGPRCQLEGGRWFSYYDGQHVRDARGLDIDHLVPLAEAWDSGASGWSPARRERFANDLGADASLVAVTARTNRSKGDQDPAEWLPPAERARCRYVTEWTATKMRWRLSVDPAEREALTRLAAACSDQSVTVVVAD